MVRLCKKNNRAIITTCNSGMNYKLKKVSIKGITGKLTAKESYMTDVNLLVDLDKTNADERKLAKFLYWQGWRIARIAEYLELKVNTLYSWKNRDSWDKCSSLDRVNGVIEARLIQLVSKTNKEGKDFKEIDLLGRQLERTARINKYEETGNEVDLNPKIANRNKGPRKQPKSNELNDEQIKKLTSLFHERIFEHQRVWYQAGNQHRIRNILKSRQIGATNYFAWEGLIDAINTGREQIFLSASKAQAFQFRQYIIDFSHEVEIDLKGEVIHFPHNDARLRFLGTNKNTAQSYHGNVYVDEYFWINRFLTFRKVVSAMASQKRWRLTYFSTPSSVLHEAFTFWNGKLFNKGRERKDHINIDVTHNALMNGRLCDDGQWKQIVNIFDAEKQGFDLFDINQLKMEYSPDEFNNLFMCEFIDDTASVFPLSALEPCMVDSWDVWTDYKPFGLRPLGERSVWVGYDPSDTGDSAGCVVVSPPNVEGGKFRIIEKHQWKGMDFTAQANSIKKITERYNVTYIGIDATGLGSSVYQLVKQFFPAAQAFKYSVELKQQLVFKMQDVIRKRRLEFDAGWKDFAMSFMSIRKTLTPSGKQLTYTTSRSEEASHGDLAWATMHAIANEPLESMGGENSNSGFIEVC